MLRYWLPLAIYAGLIGLQSSFPSPAIAPPFPMADKAVHVLLYSGLGLLFFRAYRSLGWKNASAVTMLLSVVSTVLFGLSDEWHQAHVPGRASELADVAADALGGTLGVLAYWLRFVRGRHLPVTPPD